jgi:hypothetical protein
VRTLLLLAPMAVLSGTNTCGTPGFQTVSEFYRDNIIWSDYTEVWVEWHDFWDTHGSRHSNPKIKRVML